MASQGDASSAAGDEVSALKERILLLEKELVESENTHRLRYNLSNQLAMDTFNAWHCYCSHVKRTWLMYTAGTKHRLWQSWRLQNCSARVNEKGLTLHISKMSFWEDLHRGSCQPTVQCSLCWGAFWSLALRSLTVSGTQEKELRLESKVFVWPPRGHLSS